MINIRLKLVSVAIFALIVAGSLLSKPLPAVPQAAVDELGVEYGIPRMSGFVFVDGRYIPPPYNVTRRGNGVFINRAQVEQPVPWSYFNPERQTEDSPEIDDVFDDDVKDDAKQVATEESKQTEDISSIEDLFADDESDDARQTAHGEVKRAKNISSIDDLFGDDDDRDAAPAAEKKNDDLDAVDALFSDDDDRDDVPAVQIQRPKAVKKARRVPVKLTPAQIAERKIILKKSLNEKRAFYERALAKGELYFFGTTHYKINGTYGTARALFEVLPAALRYSRSPAELRERLKAGGIYFLDMSLCDALYRHKTTFPLLQQRLKKIQLEESIKAAKRNM